MVNGIRNSLLTLLINLYLNSIKNLEKEENWIVYILISADQSRTYVGICLDIQRRLAQHNGEIPGGAKSTRAGRPWKLHKKVDKMTSRAAAQALEAQIKSLNKLDRLNFSYT
ncbi:MAG: GIY-YIG nuclease family protein [Planctomycetota bacterium]|nr:GIY-YIG nuclease family protein [Planctomycetota bacterium]